jgi:hypothetical protein
MSLWSCFPGWNTYEHQVGKGDFIPAKGAAPAKGGEKPAGAEKPMEKK